MHRFQVIGMAWVAAIALTTLATGQEEKPADKSDPPSIKLAQPLTDAMTLDERLAAKATFHGAGSSIKSFAEELEKALDTSVVLSVKKLEEAAIHLETPLSFNLRNVRVQTALRLILDEHGLTFVTHDNVIVITTEEDAGSQMVTRVYDCRDLMKLPSPVKKVKKEGPMQLPPQIGTSGVPGKTPEKKEEVGPDGGYDMEDLIETITTTVSPDSWDDVGGPGSLADFKGLLTVSQTQEVHDEVEKLLNMMHHSGGLEEKVKISR